MFGNHWRKKDYDFTSESVSDGHPDKICDQISDAILDHLIALEPEARSAIETLATTNYVLLAGEYRTEVKLDDLSDVVRGVVRDIGYEQDGFHWDQLTIDNRLHQQSPDIGQGVDAGDRTSEGAGDQGIMFGYANSETHVYLPATLFYAHKLLRTLREKRLAQPSLGLQPDAKAQVTLSFEQGVPRFARAVLLSTQHHPDLSRSEVEALVTEHIHAHLPKDWITPQTRILVNPTGRFVIGGPDGDAGLTGRKIIVDTYGGMAPHGGGAFSGKDPTKVDRSACYALRYIAKNIVASGLANECLIQIAYAIGRSQPLSLTVNTFGTGPLGNDHLIEQAIHQLVDLTPRGIRTRLDLNRPIYRPTSTFGHFGREPEGSFTWEKLDLCEALLSELKQRA